MTVLSGQCLSVRPFDSLTHTMFGSRIDNFRTVTTFRMRIRNSHSMCTDNTFRICFDSRFHSFHIVMIFHMSFDNFFRNLFHILAPIIRRFFGNLSIPPRNCLNTLHRVLDYEFRNMWYMCHLRELRNNFDNGLCIPPPLQALFLLQIEAHRQGL